MPRPFQPTPAGAVLQVRVSPRAGRNRIDGPHVEADGAVTIRIAVTAPPEDGKANEAVIALLAKSWRLPKSAIHIVAGTAARRKTLRIDGDPRIVLARLTDWWRAFHPDTEA